MNNTFFKAAVITLLIIFSLQSQGQVHESLNAKDRALISISLHAAAGDLDRLEPALEKGLESGLSVNEIKEALVHLYAYCGFPRSIRSLQTFMTVIENRSKKRITDITGNEASIVSSDLTKYERGKKNLEKLTSTTLPDSLTGYGAFAPVIDTFLKEHLFADLFDRDVLDYRQRQLVTISVLSAIGKAEPMLHTHIGNSMNVGVTTAELKDFATIVEQNMGPDTARQVEKALQQVIDSKNKN